jgi:hypothetical protein
MSTKLDDLVFLGDKDSGFYTYFDSQQEADNYISNLKVIEAEEDSMDFGTNNAFTYTYSELKKGPPMLTAALMGVACNRPLPKDFNTWEMADENGTTIAHMAARFGHLPSDFNQWELADKDGWTVAHATAMHENLPETFDQWEMADEKGRTVAHTAGTYGHLPDDFDEWELADENGWTVAHATAMHENLPETFDKWGLANLYGDTVAQAGPIQYRTWQEKQRQADITDVFEDIEAKPLSKHADIKKRAEALQVNNEQEHDHGLM